MKRRPLQSSVAAIPDFIVALFRDGADCVLTRAWPYASCLRLWWREWSAAHPGATPPAGFEHVATPPPAMLDGLPYAEAVEHARAAVKRGEAYAAKRARS